MITSVIFAVLFALCVAGTVLFPKTEGKINGVKASVMAVMLVFCYLSLAAFVYDKLGIGVHIETNCISLGLADLLLWGRIIRAKRMQTLFFRATDILSVALLALFVLAISMHMFTPRLRLAYINSDPANHFNMAMQIVKHGTLDGIYFSAYIDAAFIEFFAPALSLGKYYKAFIAADIFMHVLEICMFYVLVLTMSEKKIVRILAPLFSVGYFFGYPAYSYMTGGFIYWGVGVMILILMIYALLLVERYPNLRRYTYVMLFLAAYANSCCNRLFVPVNYLALVAALLFILFQERGRRLTKKTAATLLVLLACTVLAAALFFNFWGSWEKIFSYVQVVGWSYNSMYGDLIFFVPFLLTVSFYALLQGEYSKTISVMGWCMIACTIVMYILTYQKYMTFYYYYKIYYNLWLFGWLFAAMALDILADKKQLVSYFSYGAMIAGIAILVLTNYDYYMWHHDANYNGEYATKNLFSLYRYNMDRVLMDYKDTTMPEQWMDVYTYAAEQLEDETIPALITDQAKYCWFDAMRAQDRELSKKYFWPARHELMDIVRQLDRRKIEKVMVVKRDEFYLTNKHYFDLCEVVYENEEAAIYGRPGDRWTGIVNVIEDYSKGKQKLYNYVRKNLKDQRVPLMADRGASVDFIIYQRRTGQKMTDCYPWNFNAKENLENLNDLGIRYMLVLFEDPYYQSISAYLDSQETVYENKAGKIVRCKGEKWSTQYGESVVE